MSAGKWQPGHADYARLTSERDAALAVIASIRAVADFYRPSKVLSERFYTAAIDRALDA